MDREFWEWLRTHPRLDKVLEGALCPYCLESTHTTLRAGITQARCYRCGVDGGRGGRKFSVERLRRKIEIGWLFSAGWMSSQIAKKTHCGVETARRELRLLRQSMCACNEMRRKISRYAHIDVQLLQRFMPSLAKTEKEAVVVLFLGPGNEIKLEVCQYSDSEIADKIYDVLSMDAITSSTIRGKALIKVTYICDNRDFCKIPYHDSIYRRPDKEELLIRKQIDRAWDNIRCNINKYTNPSSPYEYIGEAEYRLRWKHPKNIDKLMINYLENSKDEVLNTIAKNCFYA